MLIHHVSPDLLNHAVRVAVIGCGGTGSALIGGLPYLHQALLAYGHPHGLAVTVYDGDRIAPANCVRQPFARSEIGLPKSVVLVNRLNLFWGLNWEAVPQHLTAKSTRILQDDLVIGCVDTRAARQTISELATHPASTVAYWLDLGNSTETGQFVLGQPLNGRNRHRATRLRTVAELYPTIIDAGQETPELPSCSAAEALDRQHPFLNPTLANHALGLLSRLFRHGISYHGGFVNLASGRVVNLAINPRAWARIARHRRRAAIRQARAA
jgi:PRTRC genetic system ThiF family protein